MQHTGRLLRQVGPLSWRMCVSAMLELLRPLLNAEYSCTQVQGLDMRRRREDFEWQWACLGERQALTSRSMSLTSDRIKSRLGAGRRCDLLTEDVRCEGTTELEIYL